MESFKEYLTEAKDRFIKKNKNLSDAEKEEVIKFFKQNRQAEGDVDWQKANKMGYSDFADVMGKYKSGRKVLSKSSKMKCPTNLKGLTNGVDYIHLKTSSKEYCCYIPFSYDTAKKFNTDKVIGTCQGSWCIGHSSSPRYWNQYMRQNNRLPVYVVSETSKWVVMIDKNNKKYEVWDLRNDTPKADPPNFNVKKYLITGKLSKMYDEIREEHTKKKVKPTRKGAVAIADHLLEDAIDDYTSTANDITNYVSEHIEAEKEFYKEIELSIEKTIESYTEKADEIMDDYQSEYDYAIGYSKKDLKIPKKIRDRIASIKMVMTVEPNGTGTNRHGETIWHINNIESKQSARKKASNRFGDAYLSGDDQGVEYTKRELLKSLKYYEGIAKSKDIKDDDDFDHDYWLDQKSDAVDEAEEFLEVANNLEKLVKDGETWKVFSDARYGEKEYDWLDDVDWSGYMPGEEHEWEENVQAYVNFENAESYIQVAEEYMGIDMDDWTDGYTMWEGIRDLGYAREEVDGAEWLAESGYPHPEEHGIDWEAIDEDA